MKKIFTEYMFLLLTVLFALGFTLAYLFGNMESYGINKTVGWAYSINNQVLISLIFSFSQIIFILGYLIIFLLKRKTSFYISLAHFELIIITLALMSFENFIASLVTSVLSLLLFFVAILKSHK
ncbi:hypothetical protein [Flavobacterium branchiicola]|uniref:Uncharacterized protein n=1 Tax=Flavobacterium branchiicola TaxID=1114875 RepID=A0ABV9PFH1_9FLAO|nr:hypothetical protein [Flavobacterium branchiicola]MBS7255233.1 hypothetical protein [Flavobacterium branchiicola]